jgi:hypothetical protein
MASAVLLGLVLFGVTLGGPLAELLLGHGPNDPFP